MTKLGPEQSALDLLQTARASDAESTACRNTGRLHGMPLQRVFTVFAGCECSVVIHAVLPSAIEKPHLNFTAFFLSISLPYVHHPIDIGLDIARCKVCCVCVGSESHVHHQRSLHSSQSDHCIHGFTSFVSPIHITDGLDGGNTLGYLSRYFCFSSHPHDHPLHVHHHLNLSVESWNVETLPGTFRARKGLGAWGRV